MKCFVVGERGEGHNKIYQIYLNYEAAKKGWNDYRLQMLQKAQRNLEFCFQEQDEDIRACQSMYEEQIKNLSCEDSEKINNNPYETPYLREQELSGDVEVHLVLIGSYSGETIKGIHLTYEGAVKNWDEQRKILLADALHAKETYQQRWGRLDEGIEEKINSLSIENPKEAHNNCPYETVYIEKKQLKE